MKFYKLKWLILLLGMCVILLVVYGKSKRPAYLYNGDQECPIKPFADFAYWPDDTSIPISDLLPGPPWQVETVIPGQEETSVPFQTSLVLARTINEEEEIWLFEGPYRAYLESLRREGSFIIYYPQSQRWIKISAKMKDSNLVVRDLFVTSDGTMWGVLFRTQEDPVPNKAPVLSKFNETTRQFEAVVGGLEISINEKQQERGSLYVPAMVMDREDTFWFLVPNDGIYRYFPNSQTTVKETELPDTNVDLFSATISPDGTIYYQVDDPFITRDFLFRYIPETAEVESINVPNRNWSLYLGMLTDHQGRLWLGAMGYLKTNGEWERIHPHPEINYEHIGEIVYAPPTLVLESSNGLLWYTKYLDMGLGGAGTAWYDPETGTGCLFTKWPSYIVEDEDKQLWMVADGRLYRYKLE